MPGVVRVDAAGWEDDRSAAGHLRTRDRIQRVMPMPFRANHYAIEVTGGAAQSLQNGDLTDGSAGFGNGINVSIPSGLNPGLRFWVPFYGPVFGVQFRSSYVATTQIRRFSLGVDGEYFGVDTIPAWFSSRNAISPAPFSSLNDTVSLQAVVDDLPPGRHMGEIVFAGDTDQLASWTLTLHNYLVAEGAGYERPDRTLRAVVQTLTTSDVAISLGPGTTSDGLFVRTIWLHNEDSGTRTVIVRKSSTVIRRVSLATQTSTTIDFQAGVAFANDITLATGEAGTGNLVTATNMVGY